MKKLLTILLLYSSVTFGQRNFYSDTIPVSFIYSDSSCKYNKGDVKDMFNSRCMREAGGYIVLWMYSYELFWANKQPVKGIILWKYNIK